MVLAKDIDLFDSHRPVPLGDAERSRSTEGWSLGFLSATSVTWEPPCDTQSSKNGSKPQTLDKRQEPGAVIRCPASRQGRTT